MEGAKGTALDGAIGLDGISFTISSWLSPLGIVYYFFNPDYPLLTINP
jgi:hypothetical protein